MHGVVPVCHEGLMLLSDGQPMDGTKSDALIDFNQVLLFNDCRTTVI